MPFLVRNFDDSILEEVGKGMEEGKICIYPTETCYGMGTNALDEKAVEKIYELKNRSKGKKLSCVVSSLEMTEKYCNLSGKERKLCEELMPGPVTLVAEKKEKVPDVLNDRFVFRIPGNRTARELVGFAGVPLVSTSANLSGAPSPYIIGQISRLLKDKTDYIIDEGELEERKPSTVVEIKDDRVKIYRQGPISRERIEKLLSI